MKQSVPKSATKAAHSSSKEAVPDLIALKAVATALAAKLTATLTQAPQAATRTATGTGSTSTSKGKPVAKASTKRETIAKTVNAAPSGTSKVAKADTGTAGAAAPAAQFENSVVSKVSEVMTKTNKSTPAANADRVLTEEEILKMDEKDYMNPAQMAFFKAKLQALEKELLKNAGETTEHLRETVLVPDPADRATIEEEHALELRTRDRERKLLKKVQQSIVAIDAGDYGWCEETGEPIGIPRLIARPTATLSLEAQQRRELKQKLYGD
jgi:DnaK suppressor protein